MRSVAHAARADCFPLVGWFASGTGQPTGGMMRIRLFGPTTPPSRESFFVSLIGFCAPNVPMVPAQYRGLPARRRRARAIYDHLIARSRLVQCRLRVQFPSRARFLRPPYIGIPPCIRIPPYIGIPNYTEIPNYIGIPNNIGIPSYRDTVYCCVPIFTALYRNTALLGGPLLLCADFDRLI